jgi:hypothetical protein
LPQNTIELSALLIPAVSLIAGFKSLGFSIQLQHINFDILHLGEKGVLS